VQARAEHEAPSGLRAFGRALSLRRPRACPEIALWLIDDGVDLEAACEALTAGEAPPYWAFCWGSGQLLARFVLDHPEEVAGRRVLDLGSGSGVVAIAARLAGAESVLAVDTDPMALAAVRANADASAVRLETAQQTSDEWDLLVASDVWFEAGPREFCESMAASGRRVLLCEPDRPGARHPQREPLLRAAALTQPDVDSPTHTAAIYRLG
jgi:predicted nicotinamide N-methyase